MIHNLTHRHTLTGNSFEVQAWSDQIFEHCSSLPSVKISHQSHHLPTRYLQNRWPTTQANPSNRVLSMSGKFHTFPRNASAVTECNYNCSTHCLCSPHLRFDVLIFHVWLTECSSSHSKGWTFRACKPSTPASNPIRRTSCYEYSSNMPSATVVHCFP